MDYKLDPRLIARLKTELREELELEAKQIARPILGWLHRWMTTARWYWLVAVIVATWPISIVEAFVMHELVGLFPGLGTLIDGVLLHHFNEWIFFWLPIALSTELLRRVYWNVWRWRQGRKPKQLVMKDIEEAKVVGEDA
jgi:hypothetical protein